MRLAVQGDVIGIDLGRFGLKRLRKGVFHRGFLSFSRGKGVFHMGFKRGFPRFSFEFFRVVR